MFPFILSPGELVPLERSSESRGEVVRQFKVKLTLYKTATMSLPLPERGNFFLNLIRETAFISSESPTIEAITVAVIVHRRRILIQFNELTAIAITTERL